MTAGAQCSAADFVRRPLVSTVDGLDGEMAAWMLRRPEFRALRIAARGAHPRAYAYLTAATVIGHEWAAAVNGSAPTESAVIPSSSSRWLSVNKVADILHVTPRRVRQLCQTGQLEAVNHGRPTGWRITRESLHHHQTHTPRRST